jgi:L-rhamnono-1,4-lactonase
MTPTSPLHAAHSVPEYTAASTADGYVFVETDRAYTSLDALEQPLDEIAFALSLRGSEGPRLLGMVPFAPIPLGREGMERWWALARGLGAEVEEMVKGVRYLVQDKLEGTMTNEEFVEGVQWALERGFVFDLGVDFRSGGRWQLTEAQGLLKRVFCEEKCVSWVVLSMAANFLKVLSRC